MTCNSVARYDLQVHACLGHAAHPFGPISLLVLQLRADAGERFLHACSTHPDLEIAAALRHGTGTRGDGAFHDQGSERGIDDLRIACAEQDGAARIRDFDALDVALREQPCRDRCDGGTLARADRGGQQRVGRVTDVVRTCLQIAFQFLLDGCIGEFIDVSRFDPVFVIGKSPEQQGKSDADPQGGEQILGFEALRH